jgi:phytanoyl-CoA hydroxylase
MAMTVLFATMVNMIQNAEHLVVDTESPEEHAPELYAATGIAEPIDSLDAFDYDALRRYTQDGYLAVENAFDPAEVQEALSGLDDLVMGRREGYDGISFEAKSRELLPTLTLENRLDAVRKFWKFTEYEPRLKAIAEHPKLMGVLRRILLETPRMFQDMALVKPPKIGREKPWHQDHAYFDFPLGTRIVGVWIALDEATLENGCMRVLSGAHREGPRLHFKKRDWQICDAEMAGCRPIAVPLRPGGLMLFDGLLPHGTPTNFSSARRRALQFHYHNESATRGTLEERLSIFGSEGKNVTC